MLAVVLLAIGVVALVYNLAAPTRSDIERDKITARVLEQAKTALIGYAVSVSLSGTARPGDLPCPDTIDAGTIGGSCGSAAGSSQSSRLGRLPWKSLGLPDLRDGDGERLWYAVSNNFKYNFRTTCASPGSAGCLNSDSRGTITVRDSSGTVVNDGSNPDAYTPSGVIAVIIAPGGIITRQDGTSQVRDCSGGTGCGATGACNSTATAKCNPVNYLDILTSIPEDNASFTDSSASDGFIQGVVRDASNNIVVNDKLLVITYNDLMPAVERRVAAEVMNCLTAYAATPQNAGRYPWAVDVPDYPSFTDSTNTRFGRLPDNPMSQTFLGLGGVVSTLVCQTLGLTSLCMSSTWPASCAMTQGTWWTNWKDIVFYGVASAYAPADPISSVLGVPAPTGCGTCLTVNPPSATSDKKVTVMVSGKRLSGVNSGQPRSTTSNKQDPANYLEGENGNNTASSSIYEQSTTSSTFNDTLLYQ